MDDPYVGQIVLYKSFTGAYTMPAIVTATFPDVKEAKGRVDIASLKSKQHVHLHVFNPAADEHGSIPHFNVARDDTGSESRSWRPLS